MPPRTLLTERLLLRPPELGDAEAIFDYARIPEISRYVSWDPHPDVDTTRLFLETARRDWADEAAFAWVIETISKRALVGMIGLDPTGHRVEMGYVLHPAYQGSGYMTEAVIRLRDWTAEQPRPLRLWASVAVGNEPSRHVLGRAGFQEEGVARGWAVFSDGPHDCHIYSWTP